MTHLTDFAFFDQSLKVLQPKKLLINTLNAHSYNVAHNDEQFHMALLKSDVLLPDGISIVYAMRWLKGIKLTKIAGADLFRYEMERLQLIGGRCFFLGSNKRTLTLIQERATKEFPAVVVWGYSPPFKSEFTHDENEIMLKMVNDFKPDVLFIGMTAPKQEKWVDSNYNNLPNCHVCSIGAVFDFYAGTKKRAPRWMLKLNLEWFYRLIREPLRMWRRYLIGNAVFILNVVEEKFGCT
jgi:N-acetylglucosaminyldiphosphoundecaprenol N-acetyl-beta-D-mannosaminyltransferase